MSQSRAKRSDLPKGYGAPLSTPKPGTTTRRRPKPGEKDPAYSKPEKKPARRKKPVSKPTKRRESKDELVQRYDSEGRPVGGGGESRNITMMDKVDEAQSGKKKKRR
jgi:hypothetical protein